MKEEHYEAQIRYSEILFEALNISWWHPVKKYQKFLEAETFKDKHKICCQWTRITK